MKKSTKKIIIAIIFILTLGLSSIAFVVTGLVGSNQQQEITELDSPIVEGEIDSLTESAYIQNGFTWVKYYYAEPDQSFLNFVHSLPDTYRTGGGQTQLIVQKINSAYLNESQYVVITSIQGQESFGADIRKTTEALCRLLSVTPIECLIGQIGQNTTQGNTTS